MNIFSLLFFGMCLGAIMGCNKNAKQDNISSYKEITLNKYFELTRENGNLNSILNEYLKNDSSFVEDANTSILALETEINQLKGILKQLNEPFLGKLDNNQDSNIVRCIYLPSFYASGKCVTIAGVGESYKVITKTFSFVNKDNVMNIELNDSLVFTISNIVFDQIIKELHKAYFWDITRNVGFGNMDPNVYIVETFLTEDRFWHYPNYHKVTKGDAVENSFSYACNKILSVDNL